MDKKSFLNIGKELFNEISQKLLLQGKEILISSKTEMLKKDKGAVIEKVCEKFSDFSEGLIGHSEAENTSSSMYGSSNKKKATDDIEKELKILPFSKNIHDAEMVVGEDKYSDAEDFENNLHGGLKGLVKGLAAGNPAEAAEVLKTLLNMAVEVSKFTEVQNTKRKEIEAHRDVYVEKIREQKKIMIVYLEKSFDERKSNFEKLFEIVDHAIANNNMEQLEMGLQSINSLAATSPFKALSSIESTQQALTDNTHVWDF